MWLIDHPTDAPPLFCCSNLRKPLCSVSRRGWFALGLGIINGIGGMGTPALDGLAQVGGFPAIAAVIGTHFLLRSGFLAEFTGFILMAKLGSGL